MNAESSDQVAAAPAAEEISEELREAIHLVSQTLTDEELAHLSEVNETLQVSVNLAAIAREQKQQEHHPFFQRHENLRSAFELVTPVVVGFGARLGVRQAASAAGILGGPVLAGLAGGAAKFSTAYSEARKTPAKLYERYIERQEARGGVWGRVKAVTEFGERAAIEASFKVEEREQEILNHLSNLGINIQDSGAIETLGGGTLAEIFGSRVDAQLLIEELAVQGRLANFYSSRGELVQKAYAEIFLTACAVTASDNDLLRVSLSSAKAEAESKALGVAAKLATIETLKSGVRAVVGYALAEAVMELGLKEAISEQAAKINELKVSLANYRQELESAKADLLEKAALLKEAQVAREAATKDLNFAQEQLAQFNERRDSLEQIQANLEIAKNEESSLLVEIEKLKGEVLKEVPEPRLVVIPSHEVEIPKGSTIGHAVLDQFKSEEISLNIWGQDVAAVWGEMVFENEGEFFIQAHDLAGALGDRGTAWLSAAESLGFDYKTGTFDKALVLNLVEKAKSGDTQALRKLHYLFHWVPSGYKVNLPESMKAVLEGAVGREVIPKEALPPPTGRLDALRDQLATVKKNILSLEAQQNHKVSEIGKIEAALKGKFGSSEINLADLENRVSRASAALSEAERNHTVGEFDVIRLTKTVAALEVRINNLQTVVEQARGISEQPRVKIDPALVSSLYIFYAAHPWLGEALSRARGRAEPRVQEEGFYEGAVTEELTQYLQAQRDELGAYLPELARISQAYRENRIQELVHLGPEDSLNFDPQRGIWELEREIAGVMVYEEDTSDGLLQQVIYENIYHTKASSQTILLYKGLTLEERERIKDRYNEVLGEIPGLKHMSLYWRVVDIAAGIENVPAEEIGRIYLNPNLEYTADAFRLLYETLAEYNARSAKPLGCRMKISNDVDLVKQSERDPFRPDKIVLYFRAEDQKEIYDLLVRYYAAAGDLSRKLELRAIKLRDRVFRENLSLFAGQVLDRDGSPLRGIGFAQEPYIAYTSYGEIISSTLARMVKEGVNFSNEAAVLGSLDRSLLALNLDPEKPYLFLGWGTKMDGREIFSEFDQHLSFSWYEREEAVE